MRRENTVLRGRSKLDLSAAPKVLHFENESVIVAETTLLNPCGYLQQVSVVSRKAV
jgi:hypothetical protein